MAKKGCTYPPVPAKFVRYETRTRAIDKHEPLEVGPILKYRDTGTPNNRRTRPVRTMTWRCEDCNMLGPVLPACSGDMRVRAHIACMHVEYK